MYRSAWPLVALVLGLPLWWVLGLAAVAPIALAVPMAVHLIRLQRTRPLHLPRGIGWWLLFLAWVVLGVLLLWVDAPGAVSGGGSSRLLVFGLRLSWYVACTIALVWVTNLERTAVPDGAVYALVGGLFVVATAGGLLGTFAPTLEFRSAIEYVLPGAIRGNSFVNALVHPEVADVQQVLGVPSARPKAPFAYTNTWGSCIALSLVFLVAAAWHRGIRVRLAAAAVVACAAIPIAYSLNRGLWVAIAAGVAGGFVALVLRRRPAQAVAALALVAVAGAAVWASPLRDLAEQRVENQHSNDRRGSLLSETVASVSAGSPVVGFGSTRDVQGSFHSIAGGATPDCPACGVPPLGTQGHLWLVLFSQGWLGLAFFLIFVVLALARSVRCRTANEAVCTFAVGIFLMQLAIYDTLGLPLMLVMIAIGLVARERLPDSERPITTSTLALDLRRGAPTIVAMTVAGAAAGTVVLGFASAPAYAGTVSVAITPAPVYLDTEALGSEEPVVSRVPDITADTEVALLLSERSVAEVESATRVDADRVRSMVAVSAVPNSHVFEIGVRAPRPEEADEVASALAESYLDVRGDYLDEQRKHLLLRLDDELRSLAGLGLSAEPARQALVQAITRLNYDRPDLGTVVHQETAAATAKPLTLGLATGAGLGLVLGLSATALSREGTARLPLRNRRRPGVDR